MRKNQRFNQHIIGRSGRVSDRRHRKTVECRGFRPLCGSSVLSCTASANRMQRAPARGRAGDRPKPPRPSPGSSKHSSGKPVRRPPFPHGQCGIRAASQTVAAGRSRTGGLSVASADTQRIRPYSGPFEIAPFRAGGVPRPEMRARLRRNGLPAEIPIPTPFAVLTRLSENDKRGCPRLGGQPLFHTTAASMPLRTTPAQAAE